MPSCSTFRHIDRCVDRLTTRNHRHVTDSITHVVCTLQQHQQLSLPYTRTEHHRCRTVRGVRWLLASCTLVALEYQHSHGRTSNQPDLTPRRHWHVRVVTSVGFVMKVTGFNPPEACILTPRPPTENQQELSEGRMWTPPPTDSSRGF